MALRVAMRVGVVRVAVGVAVGVAVREAVAVRVRCKHGPHTVATHSHFLKCHLRNHPHLFLELPLPRHHQVIPGDVPVGNVEGRTVLGLAEHTVHGLGGVTGGGEVVMGRAVMLSREVW